jgi:hypothetical protein
MGKAPIVRRKAGTVSLARIGTDKIFRSCNLPKICKAKEGGDKKGKYEKFSFYQTCNPRYVQRQRLPATQTLIK